MDNRRTADITIMREPHRWPLMDILPLRRHHGHDAIAESARLIVDGRGVQPVVVSGSRKDGTYSERRYASFDDIYDDGWRVD